jgi:hypothetical protein
MLKASASSEVHPAQNFSATATTSIFALPCSVEHAPCGQRRRLEAETALN